MLFSRRFQVINWIFVVLAAELKVPKMVAMLCDSEVEMRTYSLFGAHILSQFQTILACSNR